MDLFKNSPRPPAARTSQLKRLVAECFGLPEGATVMLTELQCREPGCPPLETVIALLQPDEPTRQFKLHKGISEITDGDILLLRESGKP